jgi:hypothetical protein
MGTKALRQLCSLPIPDALSLCDEPCVPLLTIDKRNEMQDINLAVFSVMSYMLTASHSLSRHATLLSF